MWRMFRVSRVQLSPPYILNNPKVYLLDGEVKHCSRYWTTIDGFSQRKASLKGEAFLHFRK